MINQIFCTRCMMKFTWFRCLLKTRCLSRFVCTDSLVGVWYRFCFIIATVLRWGPFVWPRGKIFKGHGGHYTRTDLHIQSVTSVMMTVRGPSKISHCNQKLIWPNLIFVHGILPELWNELISYISYYVVTTGGVVIDDTDCI